MVLSEQNCAVEQSGRATGSVSFSDTERIDWIADNYRLAVTWVLPRSVHVGLRTAIDDALKQND